jgi:hypothetical protein
MRSLVWILAALSLALATGCGEASLTLTPKKSQLCAGGFDSTDITAKVKLTNGGSTAGIAVNFSITGDGSFSNDPASAVTSATVATDANGEATVTLYSGKQAGNGATVSADFSDSNSGDSGSATITVPFTEPGAGCGAAPTSTSFTVTCDVANVAALRDPLPQIAVPCRVQAKTHAGAAVPAEAMDITWHIEADESGNPAGTMEAATDSKGDRIFLFKPTGKPLQVQPDDSLGEPSRADALGNTRCPRQGLVTIVAATRGEETWVDANANGVFDPGVDSFDDIGEPFVDGNDNGTWDSGLEELVDVNGNGKWDGPNGKWDADTTIYAVTHLLFTGAPAIDQKTTPDAATHYTLSANSTTITAPASLTVTLYLRDDNLNPVAGFDGLGSNDLVNFTTPDTDVISLTPESRPVKNQIGFTINDDGTIAGNSFLKDTGYRFVIGTYDGYAGSYTVNFQTLLSPGPAGADNWFLDQLTEDLTLTLQGQVKVAATP